MIFDINGVPIEIIEDGDRTCVHQRSKGGFEPESLFAWSALVRKGRVALDVGAYTGIYSIIAAKLGAEAIAIEPHAANAKRLNDNARINKAPVRIFEAAASDTEGYSEFGFNPFLPLTSGGSLQDPGSFRVSVQVRTIMVDALALTNVNIIKIDVEKSEPAVIRGALKTIDRCRPHMLIETLTEDARAEVAALLPGYEVAAILDGRNTMFKPR